MFKAIKYLCTIVCILATIFMTCFWVYKYHFEDGNVSFISYETISEAPEDVKLPTVSLCFENPFIENKLRQVIPTLDSETYLEFLKGNIFDKRYT